MSEGEEKVEIEEVKGGLFREFIDFIIHEKVWWISPILIILVLLSAFIFFAESSTVLPFIYAVF